MCLTFVFVILFSWASGATSVSAQGGFAAKKYKAEPFVVPPDKGMASFARQGSISEYLFPQKLLKDGQVVGFIGTKGRYFDLKTDMSESPTQRSRVRRTTHRKLGDLVFEKQRWTFRWINSEMYRIGLFDAEYTASENDWQKSQIADCNESGVTTGYSFLKGDVHGGATAWISEGASTTAIDIAFFNKEAKNNLPTAGTYHTPIAINESGDVIGTSHDRSGGDNVAAWIYQNKKATQLGLSTEEFVDSRNRSHSTPVSINRNGHVVGWTENQKQRGSDAWLFNGKTTNPITIPIERKAGDKFEPIRINDDGKILLAATPFYGKPQIWLIDGPDARNLGQIVGHPFTAQSTGSGIPTRHLLISHSGTAAAGNDRTSVWVFDGKKTVKIDEQSLNFKNETKSISEFELQKIHNNGTLTGVIRDGDVQRAWLWDGDTAKILCPSEKLIPSPQPQFTLGTGTGRLQSRVVSSNENGTVVGTAWRKGLNSFRFSWIYKNKQLKLLGLTDKQHTTEYPSKESLRFERNAKEQAKPPGPPATMSFSLPTSVNSQGQVLGISKKYVEDSSARPGSDSEIYSAWFYDPKTEQTYPIQPIGKARKKLSIQALSLSDNGIVLGNITTPNATSRESIGFIWTQENGMLILDKPKVSNKSKADWASFQSPIKILENGDIIGLGQLLPRKAKALGFNRQRVLYLLKPKKPTGKKEPVTGVENLNVAKSAPDIKLLQTAYWPYPICLRLYPAEKF